MTNQVLYDILIVKDGDDMYMNYSGLWKLLIDRNMTKADLMEITGISSRVIAKLSKNKTVTTDTIARICCALQCDVQEVMECVSDDSMSVYGAYQKFGKKVSENDLYQTVTFSKSGQNYVVYVTKAAATKATHIECRQNGTVYWVQFYPFGGISRPSRVEKVLIKPSRPKDTVAILLVKGKPGMITGLDDGMFVSVHRKLKNDTDVYVMSESAFKLFEL